MTKPFLEAEWRELVVLNFEVPREILLPALPVGVELDLWDGKALVSLVAFRFADTKILGYRIPWHVNFEELNLRFYVRRVENGRVKRGVVFIKEFVPRVAIALVARALYNEPYFATPMSHRREERDGTREIEYSWKLSGPTQSVMAEVRGTPQPFAAGGEEEFILAHHWGYGRSLTGRTIEYEVAHPPWRVWGAPKVTLDANLALTYGEPFARWLTAGWRSAFVVEGSPVQVFRGQMLSET